MSGEEYDQIVAMERQAAKYRYETEKAVQAKRSDLLVPLKRKQTNEVSTPTATAQT